MSGLEVKVSVELLERLAGYTYELPQSNQQAYDDRQRAMRMVEYVKANPPRLKGRRYIVLSETWGAAISFASRAKIPVRQLLIPSYSAPLEGLIIDDDTTVVVLNGFWNREQARDIYDTLQRAAACTGPDALKDAYWRGVELYASVMEGK